MIAITASEKEAVRVKFPNVHIVRTMKQDSKRHHYYCEESRGVMNLLHQMRTGEPAPCRTRQKRGCSNEH